jgi:hypothetical protein
MVDNWEIEPWIGNSYYNKKLFSNIEICAAFTPPKNNRIYPFIQSDIQIDSVEIELINEKIKLNIQMKEPNKKEILTSDSTTLDKIRFWHIDSIKCKIFFITTRSDSSKDLKRLMVINSSKPDSVCINNNHLTNDSLVERNTFISINKLFPVESVSQAYSWFNSLEHGFRLGELNKVRFHVTLIDRQNNLIIEDRAIEVIFKEGIQMEWNVGE